MGEYSSFVLSFRTNFLSSYRYCGRLMERSCLPGLSDALHSSAKINWFTIETGIIWCLTTTCTPLSEEHGADTLMSNSPLPKFIPLHCKNTLGSPPTTQWQIFTWNKHPAPCWQCCIYMEPQLLWILMGLPLYIFCRFGPAPKGHLYARSCGSRPEAVVCISGQQQIDQVRWRRPYFHVSLFSLYC